MPDESKRKDTPRHNSPFAMPLAKAAEKVTRPVFRKHGIAESRIMSEWPLIVGEVLADKTLPKRLSFAQGQKANGTLHLTVANGWAPEVQHLEPVILDKIATYFGYRAVGKLFMQQGPLPKRQPKPKKAPPVKLSSEETNVLASITAEVKDAELKAALESLGAAIISQKRL